MVRPTRHLVERRALDQFHRIEVDAVLGAGGVDRDDVRMVQPGSRLGLMSEPIDGPGGQPQAGAEDLERYLAVERDLTGLVDDAHAAATNLADEFKIAEALYR